MSMLRILDISASAVSAQSQRLNTVASNLANADSLAGPDGQAYRSRQVVFQAAMPDPSAGEASSQGVRVAALTEDPTPGRRVHNPGHPMADEGGYLTYSNVNPVEEMVNMISASRSYQNNVDVMNTARQLMLKTLQMGQG